MTIRVVLVDDQELVRAGLGTAMAGQPDLEVVGEAGTGAAAVEVVAATRPDVVLMDIRMHPQPGARPHSPVLDGIEATRVITAAEPDTRVLMLTTFDDDENVYAALRAGAAGFLVKDMALLDILGAVRVVAAGEALIAPSVTRRLIRDFVARPAARRSARPLDGVTEREREVLTLVGRGLSNAEIATELFIGHATAKTHVARLLTKLDARDRVQLVIAAYEAGLVG
ncbi:response regulator [Kitasatospora sp. NPDC006697]|uniref:response regulator n=1 Tax=Kitasatospora sp. NPDC006697 TaxID=3364020 RepID=UPI0036A82379